MRGRRRPPRELVAARVWWILPAGALAVLVAALLSHERDDRAGRDAGFPQQDIEAAAIKILPYRQSGLISSWQSEVAAVLVTRSMWDALPAETRRDLGQTMAVAMDVRAVRILDAKSESLVAICTAAGRCRAPSLADGLYTNEPRPTAARDE